MIGLKRRLTYDELLGKLNVDPIKKYPDRRATEIENSHYMSQLASGFREVLDQHDRVLKEKTKALVLQDYAQTNHIGHRELQSLTGSLSGFGGISSEGLRGSFESAIDFIDSKPGSESDGAESAISNTRSTYKALATTLSKQIGAQRGVIERQNDFIEGSKEDDMKQL
jgi:hypothetical protein